MKYCEVGHIICGDCAQCHYCLAGLSGDKLPKDGCEVCWRAKKFCDCITCKTCEKVVKKIESCNECNICLKCCKCIRCISCNAISSICDDCTKCVNCCKCRAVHFENRPIKFHNSKNYRNTVSRRYISFEPEISAITDFRPFQKTAVKWNMSVVPDGSLTGRNNFEINTSPAQGESFISQINEMSEALAKGKAEVNESCGCHVHVSASDFNFWTATRLIELYARLESTLFGLVNATRQTSTYCVPCGPVLLDTMHKAMKKHTTDIKQVFSLAVYNANKDAIISRRTSKYDSSRYRALNIHSFVYRGTFECRMMHGSLSANELKNWGILWANILDYVTVKPSLRGFPDDPMDGLMVIAPNNKVRNWITDQYSKYGKTLKKKRRIEAVQDSSDTF